MSIINTTDALIVTVALLAVMLAGSGTARAAGEGNVILVEVPEGYHDATFRLHQVPGECGLGFILRRAAYQAAANNAHQAASNR